MDSLTHLLVGHSMGAVASGAAGPHAAAAYWAVLIGNSLPDIDVPISIALRRGIKLHRTLTHTLPGCLGLAMSTGGILTLFFPGTPWLVASAWALLGCLAHLLMDCLNLFGARPFWPWSPRNVEMGVLHIIDPIILALLGLPALIAALGPAPDWLVIVAFFLMWPYILFRIRTARRLWRQLKEQGALRVRVIPWYNSWRFVKETPNGFEFGRWTGTDPAVMERFEKMDHPLIQASKTNPTVAAFLSSAEYPYAHLEEDDQGIFVVWGDAVRRLRADFQPLRIQM